MKIKEAKFKTSAIKLSDVPKDLPEIVFAGKSNVGKSSLINFLVNQKKLAITSSSPGRTRLVNYFLINNKFYFVDLPGYGYSKSGKEAEQKYSSLIEQFLNGSKNIKHVFILIDVRHGVTENDKILVNFCYGRLPFSIICTKADKLSKANANLSRIKIANEFGMPKDDVLLVSNKLENSKQVVLDKIEKVLKEEEC